MTSLMLAVRVKGVRALAPVAAVFGAVLIGLPAAAQLAQAQQTAQEAVQEGAASQERINEIADETQDLARNYRNVLRQIGDLREYNQQKQELVNAQLEELTRLDAQIGQVQTVQRDILPLMQRMVTGLRDYVNADIPFLLDDRLSRVDRLQRQLESPNFKVAEKFRGILEAYQIENDYGRSIEAYTDTIGSGAEARTVDFLRIGRAGLYYQTKDREETAVWNKGAGEWIVLDSGYADNVRQGISMAPPNELIPPDIIVLPMVAPSDNG